jgi:hypothetical protein
MIDQSTLNYDLPLPHPGNLLQDDVLRLRSALTGIDLVLNVLNQKSITVDLPFITAAGAAKPIRMTINAG